MLLLASGEGVLLPRLGGEGVLLPLLTGEGDLLPLLGEGEPLPLAPPGDPLANLLTARGSRLGLSPCWMPPGSLLPPLPPEGGALPPPPPDLEEKEVPASSFWEICINLSWGDGH